jgi:signal transduction histidine kinase
MLFNSKYTISEKLIGVVIGICVLPVLFLVLGVDFGMLQRVLKSDEIMQLINVEDNGILQEYFHARFIHIILASAAITIAFLTMVLAFIDFRVKRDMSTPIVGVALFCSGLLYVFHLLVSTGLIHTVNRQIYITSFTWFFCRLFHASILILGAGILLLRKDNASLRTNEHKLRFIIYISIIFVALTFATIILLFRNESAQLTIYPYRNFARNYELITVALYLISGFVILPRFYARYPSVFSQTLPLSMLPAIAAQVYMAFFSLDLFDNGFNISHVMMAFSYFIPFAGLGMNYFQSHKNEKQVIEALHGEAAERRHTEELLSGALNTSQSGIMAFKSIRNKQGSITDFEWLMANPASEKITGIPFMQAGGKKLSSALSFMKEDGLTDMFIHTVENNEALNYEYFSKDRKKWLQIAAVKMEDGFAITINDISRRKNALEEVVRSEKLAMTGRIARGIAHEVRNPLTNIQLSLHQLSSEISANEDARMYAEIIQRNAERINLLINDLLKSSKPAELNFCKYPVRQLLEESIALAKDRLMLKDIKVETNFNQQLPVLFVDPDKVKTALLNIIINAIEVMEPGKGVLKIGAEEKDHRCLITIEDNGIGISEENTSKLFEPFYSAKPNGMGLGLTSARNIITAHKGTIEVESGVGVGTKFVIGFGEQKES